MLVRALVQGVVVVVVGAVAVSAEDSAWSDVDGSFVDVGGDVAFKGVVPFGVEGFLPAPEDVDEAVEGFFVFVGAFEVAPFVEGCVEGGLAEGFGVEDGFAVEDEPAAGGGEGGAGCAGWDFASADEEGDGVEALASHSRVALYRCVGQAWMVPSSWMWMAMSATAKLSPGPQASSWCWSPGAWMVTRYGLPVCGAAGGLRRRQMYTGCASVARARAVWQAV